MTRKIEIHKIDAVLDWEGATDEFLFTTSRPDSLTHTFSALWEGTLSGLDVVALVASHWNYLDAYNLTRA